MDLSFNYYIYFSNNHPLDKVVSNEVTMFYWLIKYIQYQSFQPFIIYGAFGIRKSTAILYY